MTCPEQLIYEVNIDVDPEALSDYDPWLEDHVREMLEITGFLSAEILHIEPDADEPNAWPRRSVRYVVASREALEDYFSDHAPRMRAAGDKQFAGRYRASRRVLEEKDRILPEKTQLVECPNCNTPLNGQYCWNCGQRSRVRLITLGELLRDALGDLFELDSRLWRSLVPLVFRPGKLTHDYLEGRRARYMPPFRMYLIISIVFFLVWKMSSGGFNIGTDLDEAADTLNEQLVELEELQADIPDSERQAQIEELRRKLKGIEKVQNMSETSHEKTFEFGGITITNDDDPVPGASDTDIPEDTTADDDETKTSPRVSAGFEIDDEDDNDWHCDDNDFEGELPLTTTVMGEDRMIALCRKLEKTRGDDLQKAMFENLPAMMFFFLPLLALALKVLYFGSGRYYVEHLLFTVHYHAFFFLVVTITVLLHTYQDQLYLPEWLVGIFTAVVVFYIQPVYLYKAMRRVYDQGHIFTSIKWLVLSIAYMAALVLTILLGALVTALTLD